MTGYTVMQTTAALMQAAWAMRVGLTRLEQRVRAAVRAVLSAGWHADTTRITRIQQDPSTVPAVTGAADHDSGINS
jgi:hypothetical protein